MKSKIIITGLATTLLTSTFLISPGTTHAASNSNPIISGEEVPEIEFSKPEIGNSNLIDFGGDSSGIQPLAYDIGSPGVIVAGPYYKTINKASLATGVSALVGFISPYIPNKFIAGLTASASAYITASLSKSPTVYVKIYYVRSYSSYDGMYIFKVAIERYSDSARTKAIGVDYYEIGRSTTTKLPGI